MAEIHLQGRELLEDIEQTNCPHGRVAFWWLGQSGFAYKGGSRVIYVDLYLSDNGQRLILPPLKAEQIHAADLVLCSHDHEDHLDAETVKVIARESPNTLFVVPRPLIPQMLSLGIGDERVISFDAGETKRIKGIKITGIKAAHEFFDEHAELGFPYLGYVVEMNGIAFYHAGDTLCYDGLLPALQKWDLDAVFLPINGRDASRYRNNCIGNMTFQEAVDLAGNLAPDLAVPMHFGMFEDNTEDPRNFIDYLDAKYGNIPSWIGRVGERMFIGLNY